MKIVFEVGDLGPEHGARVAALLDLLADGAQVGLGEFGDGADQTDADVEAMGLRDLADALRRRDAPVRPGEKRVWAPATDCSGVPMNVGDSVVVRYRDTPFLGRQGVVLGIFPDRPADEKVEVNIVGEEHPVTFAEDDLEVE